MNFGAAQDKVEQLLTTDLFAVEGEDITATQIGDLINRARLIVNTGRHVYAPFLPLMLVAGQWEYGYESGLFGKRVVDVYGGWLAQRAVVNEWGERGVYDRACFEDRFPDWGYRAPGTSQFLVNMGESLVVWPPPTQDFIDTANVLSSGRKVAYRVNLYSASGGAYKLTFNGEETTGLGPNATAGTVTTALNNLTNVESGDVIVRLYDGVRHIYDVEIVDGQYVGESVELSITSNTLTGGTSTAACDLMAAYVKAQVVENDLTVSVEDSVEMPEPVRLHHGICELAAILTSKWGVNEDEAWRRLGAVNSGVVDLVEQEARRSRMRHLSVRDRGARRVRR